MVYRGFERVAFPHAVGAFQELLAHQDGGEVD